MKVARVLLDARFTVGPVPRRSFGGFVEHMGRSVYGGLFEPTHPLADEDGFRPDVIELTGELGVTTVRYPGGNFLSGYQWQDGIGPVAERQKRLDLAWHSTEPNTFGLDEFMRWAAKAKVEPIMAINLGTAGTREALELLEYCNVDADSKFANMRRANGTSEPYGVRMWCLGNEMYGPWQIGQMTGADYGQLAATTARAMRRIDPDLELVLCGLSPSGMPQFAQWAHEALEIAYDDIDYVAPHAYYWQDADLDSYLASSAGFDEFLSQTIAIVDSVGARRNSAKRVDIAFDEWNVWYKTAKESQKPTDSWPIAPHLLEDQYNVADAVVVGSLLISLLRRSDRVKAANLAQLVNVIAPIVTEPDGSAWKQTIFHPFSLTAKHAHGDVLFAGVESPTILTTKYGEVAMIDAVATHDEATGSTALFVVNRSASEEVELVLDGHMLQEFAQTECVTLTGKDLMAKASAATASDFEPIQNNTVQVVEGSVHVVLPPASWSMVSSRRANESEADLN